VWCIDRAKFSSGGAVAELKFPAKTKRMMCHLPQKSKSKHEDGTQLKSKVFQDL